MGEQKVSLLQDSKQMQKFVQNLLNDVKALEYMLDNDWFESDVVRIGAEQEMCLVDAKTYKPAPIAMKVLKKMEGKDWVETELAKFNLETNLTPRKFTGKCLSQLEKENLKNLNIIRKNVEQLGAKVILTGILPTLQKSDMEMHNLTPKKRYKALMEAINSQLIGSAYELRLTGLDELWIKHGSPMLEACNTSFQVHLQVAPKQFPKLYNISQALAGPVMAAAANSPLVFNRRLWHESRIALFQQSLDTRTTQDHMRERSPRVHFGRTWLNDSIMEIYREDIARYRVLIAGDVEEDSIALINKGQVPKLRALQVHNSTVYRWNRPCYGISGNGKPHLRIENRVFPSGPTVVDEVANAAFWLGAMEGMSDHVKDIRDHLSFDDVHDNFGKAARFGIDCKFTWFKDKKISAQDLLLKELIPLAREGLKKRKVDTGDIDRYMGILEERAKACATGARWQLRGFTNMRATVNPDEAAAVITATTIRNQEKEEPIHTWQLPTPADLEDYRPSRLKVSEFMTTDLFTVHKDDLIDLVAEMMNWRKIRYMPVEDNKGNLIGLITSRLLLRHYTDSQKLNGKSKRNTVTDIMLAKPITVGPNVTLYQAMQIMRENKIGCLPVVQNKELIGIITEMDFLRISSRLIERLETEDKKERS
ncbi:MAG: CBS domain-containing protein [Bacteroidetes bacterium]|nr:CBS domain-containing protein [Bacteroidota bacterium]